MNPRLLPCPSCARHVRVSEASCPFCTAALPLSHRRAGPAPLPKRRLGRAALAAFGAAAIATSGCGDDGTAMDSSVADSAIDTIPSFDAAYGGPPDTGPLDAAVDATPDAALDAAADASADGGDGGGADASGDGG